MRAMTPLSEDDGPDYVEVGLLPDAPGGHSRSVAYACGGCGALVLSASRERHTRFHRALAALTLPVTRIGPR